MPRYKSIAALDKAITACTLCPRLVDWRQEVALTKRKSYADHDYWGKPVAGFGDPKAEIIIVGLAPGAHGANRTGRIFTGDSSGDFLFASLHRAGLAKLPTSDSRKDGQELYRTRILCAVRCAPPGNKPTNEEKATCAPFMANEIELLLPTAKVFVALGNFAWTGLIAQLLAMDFQIPSPRPKFGHGSTFTTKSADGRNLKVIGSYHPSQQNTFTKKLTPPMLDGIFQMANQP
ncbi:MAG: uracil-DNA glycosylase [Actinomycetes bacterium]